MMFVKSLSMTSAVAACAAGAAIAFAPGALAQSPSDCTSVGSATVCNSNVPPAQQGASPDGQNGAYGPSGNTPPVGN
jgi:hypothetical protein